MATAETYRDSHLTEGQCDDETARSVDGDSKLIFTGRDGRVLIYYIFCCSLIYDRALFAEFNADTCVRIHDPGTFGDRLLAEARRRFPDRDGLQGCDLYGENVLYFPNGVLPFVTDQVKLIFSKNQRFAHQQEFRTIFATNPATPLPQRIEFILGDLTDIAEFYTR